MATVINVTTGNGTLGQIQDWSVQDDVTPTIVGSGGGSVGNINATALTLPATQYLNNASITLSDPNLGDFLGTVDSVTVQHDTSSFTAGGLLNALNIEVTAPPIYGTQTLSDAYNAYISLCFDAPPTVAYTASSNPTVSYPGWTGNAWDYIRNLAAVTKTEVVVINGVITIRDIDITDITIPNVVDITLNPNSQDTAKTVAVVTQNTSSVTSFGANSINYVKNPSVETNATSWSNTITYGTATTSPVRSTALASVGTASYRGVFTSAVPGSGTERLSVAYGVETDPIPYTTDPVNFGASYYMSIPTILGGPGGGGDTIFHLGLRSYVTIGWYNSVGTQLSTTTLNGTFVFSGSFTGWTTVTGTSVMPADTSYAKVGISISLDNNSSVTHANNIFAADAAFVSPQSATYFDGTYAGASWLGTANNSSSSIANPANISFYDAYEDNNTIYSVSAGEITKVTIKTTNSPAVLGPLSYGNYPATPGTYFVSGADNLPVVASEWAAYGGNVTATVGSSAGEIDLVITGPTTEIPGVPGPYSLSASSGSTQYATLNIAGAGVIVNPETIILQTGASNTQNELGTTIDVPFIQTPAEARTAGSEVAMYYGGANTMIEFELSSAQADGFGLTVGSMVRWNDNNYRISSCNFNNSTVRIQAVARPTGADWLSVWTGKTGANWDAVWTSTYTGSDYVVTPLKAT